MVSKYRNYFATDPPTCNKLPLAKSFLVCQFLSINIVLECFATDPPTCNKLPLAKSLLVCQFLFPVLLCWTQWSFQLFCASWTKVLFGTLLTEHPLSISHAFRTICSLSLNILSIAKVLSKRDSNPHKTNLSCYHCGRGTTSLKISWLSHLAPHSYSVLLQLSNMTLLQGCWSYLPFPTWYITWTITLLSSAWSSLTTCLYLFQHTPR